MKKVGILVNNMKLLVLWLQRLCSSKTHQNHEAAQPEIFEDSESLAAVSEDRIDIDPTVLSKIALPYGGLEVVAKALKTSLDKGLAQNEDTVLCNENHASLRILSSARKRASRYETVALYLQLASMSLLIGSMEKDPDYGMFYNYVVALIVADFDFLYTCISNYKHELEQKKSEKKLSTNPLNLEAQLDTFYTLVNEMGLLICNLTLMVELAARLINGEMDEDDNCYGSAGSNEKPTAHRVPVNTFKNIITESKCSAFPMLVGISLAGVRIGVKLVISLDIPNQIHLALSARATKHDPLCVANMASVTRICSDVFRDFTEDEMEIDKVHTYLNSTVAFACKKEDTKAQVKACRERGIELVIVSSKKERILRDIALQCGVITIGGSEAQVITGEVFRKFTDKERLEKVKSIRVLAETTPHDKLLFVKTLRKQGEVVAFHGQRTYEAPALKEADIGIAMGTWSTMKARESSDIIIENGSLSDLIIMADAGRYMYHNIKSFLQLVLIMYASSTFINRLGTSALGDASLTKFELVWVNLAVTFLGGYALLTKPSTNNQLVRLRPTSFLITSNMTKNILSQALYAAVYVQILQATGQKSIISYSFILCQFFNFFSSRELERKNFFKGINLHKQFWVAAVIYLISQISLVKVLYILGYGARLDLKQWGFCFLIGLGSWMVDWLGKVLFSDHQALPGSNAIASIDSTLIEHQRQIDLLRQSLTEARDRTVRHANKKRMDKEFSVGDCSSINRLVEGSTLFLFNCLLFGGKFALCFPGEKNR